MTARSPSALLLLALGSGAPVLAAEAPPGAYVEVATAHAMPPAMLYRLALSRSGVALASGQTRPWPWTLTAAGKTERYGSRGEALEAFARHRAQGTKDLRVGLLQLPWARYRGVFSSPEAAFEPLLVLRLGARLLLGCYAETGDWERALLRCGAAGGGKPPYRPNWTGARRYAGAIRKAAARQALDPALVAAVIAAESNFKPRARSPSGAAGLMQLMPGTAARFGVADRLDPGASLAGGTRYLRWLLDTFAGDVSLALAGYNAGENAVIRHGRRIPPYRETQDYVPRVLAFYRLFRERGVG